MARFIIGRKAWTMFGWTPGLRLLVTGRLLPCGCLTGTYDTVRDERIEIMDSPNAACRERHHQLHVVLSRTAAGRRGAIRSRTSCATARFVRLRSVSWWSAYRSCIRVQMDRRTTDPARYQHAGLKDVRW